MTTTPSRTQSLLTVDEAMSAALFLNWALLGWRKEYCTAFPTFWVLIYLFLKAKTNNFKQEIMSALTNSRWWFVWHNIVKKIRKVNCQLIHETLSWVSHISVCDGVSLIGNFKRQEPNVQIFISSIFFKMFSSFT